MTSDELQIIFILQTLSLNFPGHTDTAARRRA